MTPFRDAPYLRGFFDRPMAEDVAAVIRDCVAEGDAWTEPYKDGWSVRFGDYRVLLVRGDNGEG
jgi:hypothetical protein